MNPRLLDVLHYAADNRDPAVADGVDIEFDCVLEEFVNQDRVAR